MRQKKTERSENKSIRKYAQHEHSDAVQSFRCQESPYFVRFHAHADSNRIINVRHDICPWNIFETIKIYQTSIFFVYDFSSRAKPFNLQQFKIRFLISFRNHGHLFTLLAHYQITSHRIKSFLNEIASDILYDSNRDE